MKIMSQLVTSNVPSISLNMSTSESNIARKLITNPVTPSKIDESAVNDSVVTHHVVKQAPEYYKQHITQVLVKVFKLKNLHH